MKESVSRPVFRQPAEWESHEACWLAWPSHEDLWQENLIPAQKEFSALCRAIGASENLKILVPHATAKKAATAALSGLKVEFFDIPFGDIWLRDTAPIFLLSEAGERKAASFKFNGWGGKYTLPYDAQVSEQVAQKSKFPSQNFDWILEGGSIEVDGEGSLLTSAQCLLNPNRNAALSKTQMEENLCGALGVTRVLWVNEGLLNDHTDGHIDTIARYVGPGTVMCMEAQSDSDPNSKVLKEIARDLELMTDAKGRRLQVLKIPSVDKLEDADGRIMPASFLNFYISNQNVIVPIYGSSFDEAAISAVAKAFPTRRTLGLSAKAILSGGGAFHCITQQVPQGRKL